MGKTYTFGDNYDINAPENCSAVFNKNLGIGVKHIEKPKRKKDKETEKKIKEIVKDINSRKTYYEKARKAHKKIKIFLVYISV